VIPCSDMHQSFTDALVKRFFDNFPMFADSFRLASIHCVARGLGASFLYKCSLQQYGLLVGFNSFFLIFFQFMVQCGKSS